MRKIAAARTKIDARAKERRVGDQTDDQAKTAARDAKTAATGKKAALRRAQGKEAAAAGRGTAAGRSD